MHVSHSYQEDNRYGNENVMMKKRGKVSYKGQFGWNGGKLRLLPRTNLTKSGESVNEQNTRYSSYFNDLDDLGDRTAARRRKTEDGRRKAEGGGRPRFLSDACCRVARVHGGARRGTEVDGGERNTEDRVRVHAECALARTTQSHLPLASCIKKFIVLFCCVISNVIGPSIG